MLRLLRLVWRLVTEILSDPKNVGINPLCGVLNSIVFGRINFTSNAV